MKVIRHARYADRVMKIEGVLAVAGVGSGTLLWCVASHFGGYGFAAAAFLSLIGINSGVKAMRNYNRYLRGVEGEDAVLASLQTLPDTYVCISNFVVPGTKHGDSDLLIIGPFGLIVIEVKTYVGHYACHGDSWFRVHDNGTKQPLRTSVSRQLKRNIKAVQHYLIDSEVSAPVQGAAVFRTATRLELAHTTVPVLQHDGIAPHILGLSAAHQTLDITKLVDLFSPKTPSPRGFFGLFVHDVEAHDS
jgi:hypothetical protein